MKKLIEKFQKPTPARWQKIGYSLLIISTVLGGYIENYTELPHKNIIIGVVIVSGVVGKLLTDLTTPKDAEQ